MSSLLGLLILLIPQLVFAQEEPCGYIVNDFWGEEERVPIENCADPFDLDSAAELQDFTYAINGEALTAGEERVVTEFPVAITLETPVSSSYNMNLFSLYRHEGDDFRYVEYAITDRPSTPVTLHALATGTYSIVTSLDFMSAQVQHTDDGWLQLIKWLIPIAYAETSPAPVRGIITFTLVEPTIIEPAGLSSVLFLPGILGSHLYETGDFCDGIDNEKRLWFSTDECKQLRMTTKFTGQSTNDVYTKAGEEGIIDDAFVFFNIYELFLDRLVEWKDEQVISDYAVFPYDWRMELDNILKSRIDTTTGKVLSGLETSVTDGALYKVIDELATTAESGKVTIVAHSNGGLVIKQLLSILEYSDDPLLEKIDAVILVAVPQLGSPNSAIGVLHGEELAYVMKQAVARKLMNTMPFSYHLLPTEGYFDSVETPLVKIESGTTTNAWVEQFGSELGEQAELHGFLSRDSGRSKPEQDDVATPEIVDPYLLQYAKTTEVVQGNFVPPQGVKVHQVAGTGVPTPSQLVYFTDRECTNRVFFICTEYSPKLGYRVVLTVDGDATVPVPSALALAETENVERWWVNLYEYNDDETDKEHRNILEITEISEFVENQLRNEEGSYEYISNEEPSLEDEDRLVFQLHSPLDLSLETVSGHEVSSTTNDVSGALYRRYGELQYITIPRTEDFTVLLTGQAFGSFTLDIEEIAAGEVVRRETMSGIPVGTSTKVSLLVEKESDIAELVLAVDYDGNGVTDVEYDHTGMREEVVTYADLYLAIDDTHIKKGFKTVLRVLAKTAELFAKKAVTKARFAKQEEQTLQALIKQSILYERLGILKADEQDRIERVVQALIIK